MGLRSILFMLIVIGSFRSYGQQQDHYFAPDPPLDMFSIRPVYDAVRDLDPNGQILFSDDMTLLQLRVNESVSNEMLRSAITQRGIHLREGTPDAPGQAPVTTRADGRPLYVATNDPISDRKNYETAVESWNEAHPEDLITLPLRAPADQ